ncbi:hypothetical protein CCR75_009735 [Bremia lactucae]|uniref:NADPH--hemoprotein reductase n=1 Tax=Bremia lactucae TaxID=4779 RepID=A0A976FII9_BRELC|nr:hypothetical protein CCR75_009735 [Bremia lactucae]
MSTLQVLRRGYCRAYFATMCIRRRYLRATLERKSQQKQRFLSSGMDAFMEFEREIALKRKNKEKLLEYEQSLKSQNQQKGPTSPAPKYNLLFYSIKNSEEISSKRQKLVIDEDRTVFKVTDNNVISAPHQTTDGTWRSVHQIDFGIRNEQQELVSSQASNVGVYVPNDQSLVNRMLDYLQVEDPEAVFVAEPIANAARNSQQQSSLLLQPLQLPPFSRIGTIRNALKWAFDLTSTPRPGFLRSLAAYALEKNDVAALMSPGIAAAIFETESQHQNLTVVDIFSHFSSIRLNFADFFQIVPRNATRYYSISSSRRLFPDTFSITLGLQKADTLPIPRCSSYLAMLKQGDVVRASFRPSSFVYPVHDHRLMMFISSGTGIAPFRAFLQDLKHEVDASVPKLRSAYLFYGCREASRDFLYGEELQSALNSKVLDQLHVEFSDESGHRKRYVQDALLDRSELVARHLLIDEGYIYICGSIAMGLAVRKAIITAIIQHSQFSKGAIATEADAKRFVMLKLEEKIIVTELW